MNQNQVSKGQIYFGKKNFFWLIVLFIILFLIFMFAFKIRHINCSNCNDEQNKKITLLLGKHLFFTDFNQTIGGDVRITKLKRKLPNQVVIELEKQIELFNIINEKNIDNNYIIDENGQVIAQNKTNPNLPNLIYKPELDLANIPKLSLIFKNADEMDIKIQQVEYYDKFNIVLHFAQNYKIPKIIIDESTITTKLESVLLLNKSKEINDLEKEILEVDARFDNPVLRTKQ